MQFTGPMSVPAWLLDASHITLDSRARMFASIAHPFDAYYEGFADWYIAMDMDHVTEPIAIACEVLSDGAWQRFTQHALAKASNRASRETADACVDALRRATHEVANEYEREDVLAEAFRRRGLPLQTARNWIVPREVDACFYVVDSFGNISDRDAMCID